VYGSLSALAVGAYFAVVALITRVTPEGPVPTLFAVASVGLLVVPAHRLLQRFFGRLVYGDRGDPIRALHRVGEGMRAAGSTDSEGLGPMLGGIAAALRSPRVAVYDDQGVVAEVGTAVEGHPEHRVQLEYAGAEVGELVVAGRTEHDRLGRTDRRLVAALSGPVAAAVHAARSARELGESRARVLAVRESERTRLRADLHDGVGPSLSGISLGLEAALGAVARNPERVPEILGIVHREVGSLVSEVRGIIDDLGPADVDLLASLQRHVEAVATAGVCVELRHGRETPRLDAQVAVAAQRIAGEALTNAARHAGATRITVTVTEDSGHLVLEVCDDGSGLVAPRPGGVGLSSMRERAEAVGGTLHLDATPGAGTAVRAVLPTGVAR
jgi:signal transduction histidine kinase